MREPSGHGHAQNGNQSPDGDDDATFSDTDSEKSLLSDSDAPEPARRRPREPPQLPLLDAEHEPRPATLAEESNGRAEAQMPASNDDAVPVSWRHLPRKDQLIVITLARLSEPLVQTSLQVGSSLVYPIPVTKLTLGSRTCFTCSSGSIPSFPTRSSPARPVSYSALAPSLLRRSPELTAARDSASFTAAQFLTAMIWGRIADSHRFGRKTVLMIGLGGTRMPSPTLPWDARYRC